MHHHNEEQLLLYPAVTTFQNYHGDCAAKSVVIAMLSFDDHSGSAIRATGIMIEPGVSASFLSSLITIVNS